MKKRCFIENDNYLFVFDDPYWIYKLDKNKFNYILIEADENLETLKRYVKFCDEIWILSCFVGSSEKLLTKILNYAIKHKITNKVVVNMFKKDDVTPHINDEQRKLIKQLINLQNIKFIYQGDIEYKSLYEEVKLID